MRNPRNQRGLGSYCGFFSIITVMFLLAGCSTESTHDRSRPFFLTEEEAATRWPESLVRPYR